MTFTGAWNHDGAVLFGSAKGIQRVSAQGGNPIPLSNPEANSGPGYPQFLPDGNHFIFCVGSNDPKVQGVYWSSLDHPEKSTLIVNSGAKGVYVPPQGPYPGYLLYLRDNTLVAHQFDADRLALSGEPMIVAEGISFANANNVRAGFWASETGVLAYVTPNDQPESTLTWVGRDGKPLNDALPTGGFSDPRISPDGRYVALSASGRNSPGDVAIWDTQRSALTRLTFDAQRERDFAWFPDSKYLAYNWYGKGVWRKDVTNGSDPLPLFETPRRLVVVDWSHDGKVVVFVDDAGISAIPLDDQRLPAGKPFLLVPRSQDPASGGMLSPNGKWVAYAVATSEGRGAEIYVQEVMQGSAKPGSGPRWQVSNSGGTEPMWRADGKELFYKTLSGDFMAVDVREEAGGLKLSLPHKLFSSDVLPGSRHTYDVSADGQKFLLMVGIVDNARAADLTVVVNWQALVNRK
jgi:dipeptidyl aminopeptidase/acylaminoacyl peptidase